MDSNNNATTKNTTIDIRDVANFLLGKLWIIALVVLCFAIIAFLWTNFFVQDEYTSTTEMFIISAISSVNAPGVNGETSTNVAQNWSIGKQLTKTSSELITGNNYCDWVAKALNEHDPEAAGLGTNKVLTNALNQSDNRPSNPLPETTKFTSFFGDDITGAQIRNMISVASDEETCIVSVTATTNNATLSCVISNAVIALFDGYINDFMRDESNQDYVKTTVTSYGNIPSSPSNANSTRNAIIFGIIGAILICAILVIIFIFDDKIKTPDDIEKQLGLSVLGAIPEIDEV